MEKFDPFELYHKNGIFGMAVSGLIIFIVGFAFLSVFAWSKQDLGIAEVAAQIASSLATIALVGITSWYTLETRRLATGTEEARQREITRQKKRRKDSIRRILQEEISTIDFNSLTQSDREAICRSPVKVPNHVYKENAAIIGSLSPREVKSISSYYSLVQELQFLSYPPECEKGEKETRCSGQTESADIFQKITKSQKQAIGALENELE